MGPPWSGPPTAAPWWPVGSCGVAWRSHLWGRALQTPGSPPSQVWKPRQGLHTPWPHGSELGLEPRPQDSRRWEGPRPPPGTRVALWTALLPQTSTCFLPRALPPLPSLPITITYTVVFTQDPRAVCSITASLVSGLHLVATRTCWVGKIERNTRTRGESPGAPEATFRNSFP